MKWHQIENYTGFVFLLFNWNNFQIHRVCVCIRSLWQSAIGKIILTIVHHSVFGKKIQLQISLCEANWMMVLFAWTFDKYNWHFLLNFIFHAMYKFYLSSVNCGNRKKLPLNIEKNVPLQILDRPLLHSLKLIELFLEFVFI